MLSILRRTVFAGAGLALIGRDKLRAIASDMVKAGHLSEKEGEKFFRELQGKARQAEADFETIVAKALARSLKKLDIATQQDLRRLEKRLRAKSKR